MKILMRSLFWWLALTFLFCFSVEAGGLWLYEGGTADLGTAAAGRAAIAMDASTAAGNPAGMTRLERSQLTVAFQALFPNIKFDVDDSTFGGGDGGNAGYFTPAASFSYVHSVTSDFKLGIATGSYFGLGLDYSHDWAGRYYFQEGEFLTMVLNPVAAYRINKYLSVGGGFSLAVSKYRAKTAINNPEPRLGDGQLEFKDIDVGYGGNLGVLIEPSEGTRFGITYRSKVELEYKDDPDLDDAGPTLRAALNASGLAGSKLELDMVMPPSSDGQRLS